MKKLLISLLALSIMTAPVLSQEEFECNFSLELASATAVAADMTLVDTIFLSSEDVHPPEVERIMRERETMISQFDRVLIYTSASIHRRIFVFALGDCTIAVVGEDYVTS